MPRELRRHARYSPAALSAQSIAWSRLRRQEAAEPNREVLSTPDFVALPQGLFASVFSMSAVENERAEQAVDLRRERVTACLLADGRYDDAQHGDAQPGERPQSRLWQWNAPAGDAAPREPTDSAPGAGPLDAPTPISSQRPSLRGLEPRRYSTAVPLGDSLLWLQSTWARDTTTPRMQPQSVALSWQGQTAGATSFAGALQALKNTILLRAPRPDGQVTAGKRAAPLRSTEILERVRAQFEAMQQARRNRNWPAYGAAESKLGELLKIAPQTTSPQTTAPAARPGERFE
jgi:hypothetical protein